MAEIYQMKNNGGAMDSTVESRSSGIDHNGGDKSYEDRDDREMAYLGKKQQLKRNFGFMSMLGFSCTLMITWEGLFSVFLYGLFDGGPAGLVYGYLFCWAGYFTVVASLAEMVSMAPTAGGQYHWTYLFAPKSSRNFLSFITGWQSVLAWQALLAAGSYLGGSMLQGLLVLNYPSYAALSLYTRRWQGTLLLYATVLFTLFFNIFLSKHLPKVEGAVLIIHIVGFFGILIPLVYLAPHGSVQDVFVQYLNTGGYTSGVSFFVGLSTSVFAFLGADGAIHMCEEIKNASTVVPQSLLAAIAINGVLGFAMMIAILFCIGDIDKAISTPTGYPFIEIFYQATNSMAGAIIMSTVILGMTIMATIAVLAAASRMMWAFARDNGLPGSSFIGRVEPRTKLPLYSIGISVLITLLLGLINIGSTAAFNAVLSLVIAGYQGSYIIPISLLLYNRIKTPTAVNYGPFSLGKFGIPCNIIALCWMTIIMVFSFFPTTVAPTLQTMNWSCVLWSGTMIIGVLFYFLWQRGRYNGPIVETTIVERLNHL